jgi:hypothetical protein
MVLVSEVVDVIRVLGDVVEGTTKIVDAVNDGRKYLAAKHPEAEKDFDELLAEMQRAIEGLAAVTKVFSFSFVVDTSASDAGLAGRELVRFNDYIIEQQKDIAKLWTRKRKLKADCEKIRALRDKLDARTKGRAYGSLFSLLGGKAKQRELELHGALSSFYADDQRMIAVIEQTLQLAEAGIKDVEATIGSHGTSNPFNVPKAAEALHAYAVLFAEPYRALNGMADALSEARAALVV